MSRANPIILEKALLVITTAFMSFTTFPSPFFKCKTRLDMSVHNALSFSEPSRNIPASFSPPPTRCASVSFFASSASFSSVIGVKFC